MGKHPDPTYNLQSISTAHEEMGLGMRLNSILTVTSGVGYRLETMLSLQFQQQN